MVQQLRTRQLNWTSASKACWQFGGGLYAGLNIWDLQRLSQNVAEAMRWEYATGGSTAFKDEYMIGARRVNESSPWLWSANETRFVTSLAKDHLGVS